MVLHPAAEYGGSGSSDSGQTEVGADAASTEVKQVDWQQEAVQAVQTAAAAAAPELYLCYTADGGLANQMYSHIAALAAAIAIGAKGIVRSFLCFGTQLQRILANAPRC